MKKYVIFGLLALATATFVLPTHSAKAAVVYTVSGTVADDPQHGTLSNQTFSFSFTSANFITSSLVDVPVDGCTVSGSDFTCSQASFLPAEDKGSVGFYDQVDFKWINADLSGGGGAQILFALGAFSTIGTHNVDLPDLSVSRDAVMAVSGFAETPIPGALPLFATGLGALGLFSWRRKRKAAIAAA